MDIVKKNLFSIICGVIAILAVVALFWPIGGMYDALMAQLDTRIQMSNSIDSVTKASRTMPQLSPDSTGQDTLPVFPNEAVIAKANDAIAQVSLQAKNMLDTATKINVHTLLLPDELPKPVDAVRYAFADQYAAEVANYARWQKVLDSTSPPSAADVQAAKDKRFDDIKKDKLIYDAQGNPDSQSQADAQAEFDEESPMIQPRMELEQAQQHQIYLLTPPAANPLPVDTSIKVGSYPTPEQICDAQIVLWVLDDVCGAIARTNESFADPETPGGAPKHDILHDPIKAIEGIDPPAPMLPGTAVDPTAGVTAPVPKVTTVSPTGRVCNGRYDVLRFKMRLVVDAAKLPIIIKSLEAGQFITVLNVQVNEVVDPAVAASNPQGGFRYGNKPVVRVELDCEELLMRTWTDAILPDDRKNGLGKAALGAPTDQGMYGPNGPNGPGGPMGGPPVGPFGAPPQ